MNFDEKTIVFDTETTGLYAGSDELLQLSIIDGTGRELFNEYIKPSRRRKWPEAERVNHISPEMVKDCKTFRFFRKRVQEIFDAAEIAIAYNAPFDLRFLKAVGIDCYRMPGDPETRKTILDPMLDFAPVYGEFSEYYNDYKWQKLVTAAHYYGYDYANRAHDSLEDVRATLHVARELYKDK